MDPPYLRGPWATHDTTFCRDIPRVFVAVEAELELLHARTTLFATGRAAPPQVHQQPQAHRLEVDGPTGGGEDCGQNTSVCGTYATLPWYANDLGHRAQLDLSNTSDKTQRSLLCSASRTIMKRWELDPVAIHPDTGSIYVEAPDGYHSAQWQQLGRSPWL